MLKTYLMENYGYSEPIFLNDLSIEGLSENAVRQSVKRLVASGFLERYDNGIYYIPKHGGLLGKSYLDPSMVIIRKYVENQSDKYGYITGLSFANQLGLTTQMPAVIEIVTNRESTNGRMLMVGNQKVRVKKSSWQLHIDADMVVLAAAIEPDKSARPLATMLTASMDTNDFFTEAHPKLRPVESPTAGVFLSGMCQGPKDIPETVAQASAAAAKVIGLLCKDSLTCNPCVAQPDEMMCNGCSSCEKVCPYGAITYQEKEFRMPDRTTQIRRVASVNPAVCQGCGACTVACPSGAMDLNGFSNKQIMAEVDAICK